MKTRFILIYFLVFIVGCTSKVNEILDEQTKQERILKSELEEKERASKIEVLENSTSANQAICISSNQVKLLVTENSSQPIKCMDETKFSDQLKEGPVCPGGVELKKFTASTSFVDCSAMTLCGNKPTKIIPLSANDSSLKLTQLVYERLPWGCLGKIKVKGTSLTEVPLEIKPPPCEHCKNKGIYTCEACGDDKILPKILDVVIDKSKCRSFNIIVFAEDGESGLHREPYSFDGGLSWTDVNNKVIEGRELSVAAETIWVRDRGGNITKYMTALTGSAQFCSCTTPWGEVIPHNESRKAFQVSQVECTLSCDAQAQTRRCDDGKLLGEENYKYGVCTKKNCPGCTTPWGETVKHGDFATAYKQSEASCKDQCEPKTATCDNGKWSPDLAGFAQKECRFTQPKCDCEHSGRIIKNNDSIKVYTKDSYACNEPAVEGSVRCTMGTLNGNTDYNFFTFSNKPCKCVTPWGQILDKEESINAYKKSVTTCTDTFSCEDVSNRIRIKCIDNINNTMQLLEGLGPIEEFRQPSCSFKPCKCKHLNVEFGPGDPPLTVYKSNKAIFPNRCDLNGNKGSVKCTADILLSGDTSTAQFPYTECSDETAKGDGTGNSDYDKGLGAGGGSGGGLGNDEGDGEGFRRRSKGGGGGGCNPDIFPYYCATAGLSMYINIVDTMCLLPGEDGYSVSNTNSTHFSQRIGAGGWIAAYSRKEVTKPDSCSKYMGIIRCTNGKMSESNVYKYLNCTEKD